MRSTRGAVRARLRAESKASGSKRGRLGDEAKQRGQHVVAEDVEGESPRGWWARGVRRVRCQKWAVSRPAAMTRLPRRHRPTARMHSSSRLGPGVPTWRRVSLPPADASPHLLPSNRRIMAAESPASFATAREGEAAFLTPPSTTQPSRSSSASATNAPPPRYRQAGQLPYELAHHCSVYLESGQCVCASRLQYGISRLMRCRPPSFHSPYQPPQIWRPLRPLQPSARANPAASAVRGLRHINRPSRCYNASVHPGETPSRQRCCQILARRKPYHRACQCPLRQCLCLPLSSGSRWKEARYAGLAFGRWQG